MQAPVHRLFENKEMDLEKENPQEAINLYSNFLKKNKLDQRAYNRLMILYRKQKEYKKEAALIRSAIEVYEAYYKKHMPSHSARITTLSRALSISTGLTTKKGRPLFDPEPIATWRKRLTTVNNKIK